MPYIFVEDIENLNTVSYDRGTKVIDSEIIFYECFILLNSG